MNEQPMYVSIAVGDVPVLDMTISPSPEDAGALVMLKWLCPKEDLDHLPSTLGHILSVVGQQMENQPAQMITVIR